MVNEKGWELCEHMEKLVKYAKKNKVEWGGCGDCGSPWLTCNICDLTVDHCNPEDIQ